ncbi:YqaJ viral recombinase family protein [Tupanvirus soda lake]|uniref:YqaJ viral recombinase family protein n=2 Tax=Tupanvirus TaxID=2094720 RepID=A0A6N1P278_9VIRU|nr:YqaJ viral recombinase family protein [Tupanvirus soda lake]QKU35131.1 YqaJ viral recombinase family protein [Tupanvirus soda lake]
MKLSYYNEEVDKILWDAIGNDSFIEADLPQLIEFVTETIYQYNTEITKDNLKLVVQFLIEHKYQKYYVYDVNSEYNKISEQKSTSPNKKNTPPIKTVPSPVNNDTNMKKSNTKSESSLDSDIMSINESETKLADDDDDIEVVSVGKPSTNYINSELASETNDKIQMTSHKDLVSHRHDYAHAKYKETIYIRRRKRIVEIKKIPQHEQKSKAWLNQRSECLTATAIATALDEDPYKYPAELLLDKCGRAPPFEENENVHHGKKYEEVGNMFYSFRNNILVAEYGLIQHDKYTFIGASPDGICEKNTADLQKLSKLVGRLLEIKFPKTRKIITEGDLDGEICPHYYYVQVQTQLYVTKMDECDFLQCQIEEYDSWEEFVQDSNTTIPGLSKKTNLEKGCLIQLLPRNMLGKDDPKMCLYNAKYIYPPRLHMTNDEIQKWISEEVLHFHKNEFSKKYVVDRIIYWRLAQVACNLIKADTKWFESKIPMLKQFWDYVLFYRKYPKKLDRLQKYIEEIGAKNSAEIFARVHKDYISVHKNTKYEPLYQEETEWRKIYNKKKASYQKYQEFLKNKSKYINRKKKNIIDV